MKASFTLASALLLTSLGSLAGATRYPYTFTDDLGRKVTLRAEPQRVISVLPSTTETLCAIGACGKLVAVDDYSDFPASVTRLPKVGGLYDPKVEAMVAQKPDLILVSKYGKLPEQLTALGIPFAVVNPETYDDVFNKTFALGKIVNREAQAKALVTQMKRDIARVEILTRTAPRQPTVYFEIDPTPYTVGPNSFMGVLIAKAGGRNVIPASLGDFPKIDPELIVKANPQVMLGLSPQAAAARPGWAGLQAVRSGRVQEIPKELNTILGRPGPRLPQALRGLARLLHPQLIK